MITADLEWHPEFMQAIALAAVIGLLMLKPLAVLGRMSILVWIEADMASRLNRVPRAAWITAPLVAMLLCGAMLPQSDPDRMGPLIALALLTGLLAALLINLTHIDARCRLLPDPLTGLLIASGITAHAFDLPPIGISLIDGLIGCVLGYGLLWLMAWLFRWFRHTEAMGRGDFAMSAGLGAWLGWQSIPMVWMVASLAGIGFAWLTRRHQHGHRNTAAAGQESPGSLLGIDIPFGPALALGAIATWVQLG